MTFSDLDFARLGLSAETGRRTSSAHDQNSTRNRPPPFQLPPRPTSIRESLSEPDFFYGQLPNSTDPIPPDHAHIHQSQTESRSENATPTTMTQTGVLTGTSQRKSQQPSLPRRRSRYFRSQQHQSSLSSPVDIPGSTSADDALDPMQRWRESPPETEPASLSAIADALKDTSLRTRSSTKSLDRQRTGSRAASITSFGSSASYSSASNASANSAPLRSWSARSRGRVTKQNRQATTGTKEKNKDKKMFACTFCCDSFKSKYGWARHEKSLHLNLQGWRCTPFGSMVVSPDTGRTHCAYCSQLDPDAEHLESHNYKSCDGQGRAPTFSRKDHLVQHLRLVHHVKTLPIIDSWKDEDPLVLSRCGFCNIRMQTWQERVDHLAKHFREGATMDDWKGEHCFEPSIAVKVTHAMPPYLIGAESRALVPFSVTSHGTRDHLSQLQQATEQSLGIWDDGRTAPPMNASVPSPESAQPAPLDSLGEDTRSMTFPEVLTLHLGRYAQEHMRLGIIPTDKMFQDEARRIMYGTVDPLDHTIADNEDWLSLFRDRHLTNALGSSEDAT